MFTTNSLLSALAYLLLDAEWSYVSVIHQILYLIGLWKIFQKCGVKGWWAFVPFARHYKLGRCADRESESRTYVIVCILMNILNFAMLFFGNSMLLNMFDVIFYMLLWLILFIYRVRICLGLIGVFDRRNYWIIPWIIPAALASLIFGFGKKFQPLWNAQELLTDASEFFSGSSAAVLDQGLTVNLEERTTREFFRKKYLLRDIHMYIPPGHMVLLLGGSGAGKTTFLNAVNGYEPAKAEVVLNGKNMYKYYKSMQYDIGFVPQQDLIRGSDTVFRTLMDTAALRLPNDFSRDEREARVDEVMEIFGLTPVKKSLVDKLSGGQRKRLSIAMEFISNPAMFILDEPDSGLDGVMARELFTQLKQISKQGKIILVITHTPDRVIDLFDDVIVLAKDVKQTGRLAWYGPIEDARKFFEKEKMEEIVKAVNRPEEGGEGLADEYIMKFAEVQHV